MKLTQTTLQELKTELESVGILVKVQEPLYLHNTFKIGGKADLFIQPTTVEQLAKGISIIHKADVPFYILGNGSNVLFADAGFAGVIVHINKQLSEIHVKDNTIIAQAGASLKQACVVAQQEGLSGMEFAYGIPGTVGGALYMNAGAYGGEMSFIVSGASCIDHQGQIHHLSAKELQLGYRTSCFHQNKWCILEVEFKLHAGNSEEILAKMQDYMTRRKTKQPLDKPSAGSAFKRPEGAYASALIDQCGLKGYCVGGAAISEKHAGFIVNLGNATCSDVLAVANNVSEIVKEKTGFVLEKEIRVVGEQKTKNG